ncbi:hypothetical protein [Gluconobacter wancherniae]|uniref:Uncharacterized protein n=1 Tax=Gluconobacter wancherniae NBRC 103581 TaxID=656744 RepID=A0A511B2V1_9PROT|nr:hypothetical protein [Gluconobacter wancherniae]GBD57243.1 hypothetical protein NBRC103581_01829 [Gluconobacter wancherniae NBRC 103581]GBR65446.1 hypothetical protein AA103581_1833 [Gluconobacter wancherniae NBRC 103581]GEK93983.1 hypothetical protein GWA01_17530 [Gluconobacter wancherniae NBRC 103581]
MSTPLSLLCDPGVLPPLLVSETMLPSASVTVMVMEPSAFTVVDVVSPDEDVPDEELLLDDEEDDEDVLLVLYRLERAELLCAAEMLVMLEDS